MREKNPDTNEFWKDHDVHPMQWLWDMKDAQKMKDLKIEDIYDAAIHFGRLEKKPWRREVKILCPNPEHEDNNPSCSLWKDINAFKCWSCGCSGKLSYFIYLLEQEKLLGDKSKAF